MKTKTCLTGFMVGVILFMAGCNETQRLPETLSDIVVSTAYDPQVQFPNSATYDFLRRNPEDEGLPPEAELIVRRLRQALEKELGSKGYHTNANKEVDYLVDYQIVAQHNVSVIAERSQTPGREWMMVVGVPDDFIQGSLVVDIIDMEKLMPVWRGVCNVNIAFDAVSEKDKQIRAKYVVSQLLKTFPPK